MFYSGYILKIEQTGFERKVKGDFSAFALHGCKNGVAINRDWESHKSSWEFGGREGMVSGSSSSG